MLTKLNDFKGVIIFYILLALVLVALSYRSKQIDMHQIKSFNNTVSYSIALE